MAGTAVALRQDLDPDGVLITINAKFGDPLNLTAGLALFQRKCSFFKRLHHGTTAKEIKVTTFAR